MVRFYRPVKKGGTSLWALGVFALHLPLLQWALAPKTSSWGDGVATLGALAVWTAVALSVSSRALRVTTAMVVALALVAEGACYRFYRVPVSHQVVVAALRSLGEVRAVAEHYGVGAMAALGITAAFEYVLLSSTPKLPRGRLRVGGWVCVLGLVALAPWVGTEQGWGPVWKTLPIARALRMRPRDPTPAPSPSAPKAPSLLPDDAPVLPAFVSSRRPQLPNGMFILSESIRASDYGTEGPSGSLTAPRVSRAFPTRVTFRQMRSIASYTMVAFASLLTGRMQVPSKIGGLDEPLPDLFDLLGRLRGEDGPVTCVYWSSQGRAIFRRTEGTKGLDSVITLESLVGRDVDDEDDLIDLGMDFKLEERILAELPRLEAPFFVFVHLSGTHAPYFVDPKEAPFRPWNRVASWSGLEPLHNAYKNAIFAQDRVVASLASAFVARQPAGQPYFVAFTSDHGEAFGEHRAIHHGQNLYDEQIHVPLWFLPGPGLLTDAERGRLFASAQEPATHLDVVPTVMDLYGAYDALSATGFWERLPGHSWLRAGRERGRPIAMSNCTPLFPCPLNTWGLLDRSTALVAQPWDADWQCVDLGSENLLLPSSHPTCQRLRGAAKQAFSQLPNGALVP